MNIVTNISEINFNQNNKENEGDDTVTKFEAISNNSNADNNAFQVSKSTQTDMDTSSANNSFDTIEYVTKSDFNGK